MCKKCELNFTETALFFFQTLPNASVLTTGADIPANPVFQFGLMDWQVPLPHTQGTKGLFSQTSFIF
jgi:hypothetical protein